VSPIDKFLKKLWQEIPESNSQRAERIKNEIVADFRDNVHESEKVTIWEGF
jgi:hypothetical protein